VCDAVAPYENPQPDHPPSIFRIIMGGPENTSQITASFDFPFNDYITQANFPLTPGEVSRVDEIAVIEPKSSFDEKEGLRLLSEAHLERPTYEHALRFAQQHARASVSDEKCFILFLHEAWQGPGGHPRALCFDRSVEFPALSMAFLDVTFDDRFVLAGIRRA
jgi:hypothetical protein